jgi:transcriptional regulator with XRE-family HTH domain
MTEQTPQPPEGDEGGAGMASALIKARNERGLTQAQLADRSGVSRSAIKGYETGRTMPGARELKALCVTLKVSPTALLYGSDEAFQEHLSTATPWDSAAFKHGRLKWQLSGMVQLLPDDEVAALLHLARAIVVARHGADMANQKMEAGAALMNEAHGPDGPKFRAAMEGLAAAIDAEDEARAAEVHEFLVAWLAKKAADDASKS